MAMARASLLPLFFLMMVMVMAAAAAAMAGSTSLDPKQLAALQSMGLPTRVDPCSSSTKNLTLCDSSTPFRHLISLTVTNCSSDLLDISSTALRSLSTLRSLSFLSCPSLSLHRPLSPPLALSLLSFACSSSFKRLSGVFLSRLGNLNHLTLTSVPVSASGPFVFLSHMPHLVSATVSNCSLTGRLPRHWRSLNLTLLDLSSNKLIGSLPGSISILESLVLLNLSGNALSGTLPDAVGELAELTHLDLGSNRLNGSVPGFIGEMSKLRYLNLEANDFRGVMPFNASFIDRLQVFKIGGNGNLCYNRSLINPAKLKLGIAACDKYGMPVVSPPPQDKGSGSDSTNYDDDEDDDEDGDEDDDLEEGSKKRRSNGDHHGGPNKLVLAVAIGLSCLVFLVIFLVCISKCY